MDIKGKWTTEVPKTISSKNRSILKLIRTGSHSDRLRIVFDLNSSQIEHAIKVAKTNFNSDGLLIRIKALNDLIDEDANLKKVYWLFTVFIFLLEFIVIIAKVGSKKSIDEEIEMFRDQSTLTKLQQYKLMLQNNDQSVQYLPKIVKANALLDKHRNN